MRWARLVVPAIAAAAVAAGAGAAQAGPSSWTPVTPPTTSALDELGLARTGDGFLYAAWVRRRGDLRDLLVTPFDRAGVAGRAVQVVGGWRGIGTPALVSPDRRGLVALWPGIRSLAGGDPYEGLVWASSVDRRTWTAAPTGAVPGTASVGSAGAVTAALGPGGTVFSSWYLTFGVFVKPGLAADPPARDYLLTGCCYYNPTVAADGRTGALWAGWDSNTTHRPGRLVRGVAADGAPSGPERLAPGSSGRSNGRPGSILPAGQRVPITGLRGAPGVFTLYPRGYPTPSDLALWRVDTGRLLGIARNRNFATATLAVAPDSGGRLWAAWVENTARGPRLFARRTNRGGRRLGRTVSVSVPARAVSASRVNLAAGAGGLDAFVNVSRTNNYTRLYHRRILPVFTVQPRLGPGRRSVTLLVRDAGTPVRGARIVLGGRRARTGRTGRATLPLPPGVNFARVTAAGYQPGKTRLVGRPRRP